MPKTARFGLWNRNKKENSHDGYFSLFSQKNFGTSFHPQLYGYFFNGIEMGSTPRRVHNGTGKNPYMGDFPIKNEGFPYGQNRQSR